MTLPENSTATSRTVSEKAPYWADTYPVEAANQLLAVLPSQGVYALIDMAFKPSLNDDLRHSFPALDLQCLFSDVYSGVGLMEIAPWLIPLPDATKPRRALVEYLLRHTCGTPMLSFIASQHTNLLTHLQQQLDAENPQGEGLILRLADSRAFDALLNVITAEQRQRLLLPDMHWWYWQLDGELAQVNAGDAGEVAKTETGPYHFSAEQLTQLSVLSQAGKWLHVLEQQRHFGQLTGSPSQVSACLQNVLDDTTQEYRHDAALLRAFKAALIKENLLAVMGKQDGTHE